MDGVESIGGRRWSNNLRNVAPPLPLACWIFDNVLHAGSALHIGAYGQIRIASTSSYGVIRVCAVMRIQMRGTCPRRGGPAARDKTFRLRSRAIGILINPPLRLHVRCLLLISLLFRTAESVPSNLLFQGSRCRWNSRGSILGILEDWTNARRENFLCD